MSRPNLTLLSALALAAFTASIAGAANPPSEGLLAPLPAQILTAKTVFIANAGDDTTMLSKQPYRLYNHFYSGLKTWGHYQIVDNPAAADLVLEVRSLDPLGTLQFLDSKVRLTIYETKSHFLLWSVNEHLVR